jgi:hypothetical protein
VWVIFGLREERTDEGLGFGCTAGGKEMGKMKKKIDLKTVHAGLKLSTFERTGVRSTVLV